MAIPEEGLGRAINDRLRRAAAPPASGFSSLTATRFAYTLGV